MPEVPGASDEAMLAAEPVRIPPRAVGTRRCSYIDTLHFTAPVTIADMTKCRDRVRTEATDAEIDIHCPQGDEVFLELRWPDQIMQRTYVVTA